LPHFKAKKEFQFPHHGHLKLVGHLPRKLIIERFVIRTKNDFIYIELAYEKLPINVLSKKTGINLAYFKSTVYKCLSKVHI
jgi:transketolase C-terminal domain/subunit